MPTIWIPPQMRDLTGGKSSIRVRGKEVREALASLEAVCPGVWERLRQGDDLSPSLTVVVDGEESSLGIYQPLEEESEVHFLPLMAGG